MQGEALTGSYMFCRLLSHICMDITCSMLVAHEHSEIGKSR